MNHMSNQESATFICENVIAYTNDLIQEIDNAIHQKDEIEQFQELNDERILKIIAESSELIRKKIEALKKLRKYENSSLNYLHFALVAFIDEKMITKNWTGRTHWQSDSLERKHFQSRHAGDQFYEICKKILLDRDYKDREIAYCFYLCLCAGFLGKFHSAELQSEKEQIQANLYHFHNENHQDVFDNTIGIIPISSFLMKHNREENSKQRKFTLYLAAINIILVLIFILGSLFIWSNNRHLISASINALTNF